MTSLMNQSFNRRGQGLGSFGLILAGILALLLFVAFGVIGFKLNQGLDSITPGMERTVQAEQYNASREIWNETHTDYSNKVDNGFFYIFMAMVLALLTASWFARDHPVFLVVFVIIFIVIVYAGGMVSNYWFNLMNEADNAAQKLEFPKTNFILENLMMVVLGLGASCFVVYAMREYTGAP